MAIQTYGVTAEIVRVQRLTFFSAGVQSGTMDAAIKDAATDLSQVLTSKGIDPFAILSTGDTEADYEWCANTVEVGAAAYYCVAVAAQTAPGNYGPRFQDRLNELARNPQILRIYGNGTNTSDNTARSSANVPYIQDDLPYMPQPGQRNTAARMRFLRPDQQRGSWRL